MLEGATISDRDQLLSDLEKSRGLPAGTLSKIWQTESGRGQNLGPSRAGARGHFGFMPGTAATYGVKDPDNFDQSATGAANYLSDLRQQFGGDMNKALASYNWGPHRVQMATAQYGDQWATALPSETRHYLMATSDAAPDPSYGNINAATMNLGPWAADWQRRKAASDAPYIRSFAETQQRERELAAREQDRPEVTAGPAPQVPQPDPVRGFASAAGIFAMIASAMTHTPMVAAMSSMAAAINARNQNDMTTYEKEYKQWKEQTDQALKMDAAHRAKVQQALELMKTDFAAGQAMLNAVDTEYNDEKGMVFSLANDQIAREQLNVSRGRLSQEMQNHKDQLELEHERLTQEKELREEEMKLRRDIFGASGKGTLADAMKEWEQKFVATNGREPTAEERLAKQAEFAAVGKPPTPGAAKEADVETLAADKFTKLHGHPPDMNNPADKAELATIRSAERSGAGQKPLTEEAADQQARFFLRTGHLQAGFGGQNMRVQIMEKAAEIAKGEGKTVDDYLSGQATLKADTSSLAAVTKQKNAAEGYERGALKSLDLMVSLTPKAPEPLNMQILTRWARTGETEFGDVSVPAWQAALITSLDQYAKVLSGATGAQGSTDSARALALSLIPAGSTSAQIPAIVNVLKKDMDYKVTGYNSQISDIKHGIAYPDTKLDTGVAMPVPKTQGELVKGQLYDTARGRAVWDGTQFVPEE